MENYEHNFDGSFFRKTGEEANRHVGQIPYKRSPRSRLKPRTEVEKLNAHILTKVKNFLLPLDKFLRIGFRNYSEVGTAMGDAISYVYEIALYRDGYDSAVDPYIMQISAGRLVYQENFEMHFDADTSEVCVSWDPALPSAESGEKAASDQDQLMIVAYDPWGSGEAFGKIYGAYRRVGFDRLKVPIYFPTSYFVYVAFLSADGTDQASSICLGAVEVGKFDQHNPRA